jgi:hypothetical protein
MLSKHFAVSFESIMIESDWNPDTSQSDICKERLKCWNADIIRTKKFRSSICSGNAKREDLPFEELNIENPK